MFRYHPLLIIHPRDSTGFLTIGKANGYIAVPDGHPWYGAPYDSLPLQVHGGLTYSNHATLFGGVYWVIGFDTGHFEDTPERWTIEAVWQETLALWEQVMDFTRKAEALAP